MITTQTLCQTQSVIEAVSTDSMIHTLKELTGALPVTIGGIQRTINTRLALTTGNRWASQFLDDRFTALGLTVEKQSVPFVFKSWMPPMNHTGLAIRNGSYYLSTDWGEVFRSRDSGSTWTSMKRSEVYLTDGIDWISLPDTNTIVALGRLGKLAKSTDNGVSWQATTTGLPKLVHAASNATTMLAADTTGNIWRSKDLGETWSRQWGDPSISISQLVYGGSSRFYAVGKDSSSQHGRLIQSDDDGITWSLSGTIGDVLSLRCGYATDALHHWIAGANGAVYKSVDSGTTWSRSQFADSSVTGKEIFFIDALSGWIVGVNNTVYNTRDGGTTWQPISSFSTSEPVANLRFSSSNRGIILGNLNTHYLTTDGGHTWMVQSLPLLTNVIASIPGTQNRRKYILVAAHYDCTTSDNADKYVNAPGADDDGSGVIALVELARIFSQYRLPISITFTGVPDEESIGAGAHVLPDRLLAGSDSLVVGIDFDMIGYDDFYPRSAGLYYTEKYIPTKQMADRFINASRKYDLNITFSHVEAINANLLMLYKSYPILGIAENPALGTRTNLNYHSRKDVWSTINPDYLRSIVQTTAAFIYDLAFESEGLNPDPPPIIEPKIVPGAYSLTQNFPNPFNPVTSIRYGLPQDSFVSVKIFDVLGREIASLVNTMQTAGEYTIQWNGACHPSAMYFCKMTAGEYSAVRSMVLAK